MYAPLTVSGSACFTGAGDLSQTLEALAQGGDCRGTLSTAEISRNLSPNAVRRLQRLPRMALSLAAGAQESASSAADKVPAAVVFATGWGPLSETAGILDQVVNNTEELTSPTHFVGSVHNSPAGQIAIHFQATGPNLAVSGDDTAFEQAIITAQCLAADMGEEDPLLVVGADEFHETLSPLFDASVALENTPSDGGAGLWLQKAGPDSGVRLDAVFYRQAANDAGVMPALVEASGGLQRMQQCFGVLLVGVPLAQRQVAEKQLAELQTLTQAAIPVVPYRKFTGEHASASAVATVLAAAFVRSGALPDSMGKDGAVALEGKGALVIGLGKTVTAVEVLAGQAEHE